MAQSSASTLKQPEKSELPAKVGKSSEAKKAQKSKSQGKTVEPKKMISKKAAPKQVDPPKLISKPEKSAKLKGDDKKSKKASAKKASIKADFELGREEAAAYLQNLANGLKSGAMSFRKDDKEIILVSGDKVSVKVKGKSSGKKGSLSFDLKWESPKSEKSKSD